MENRKTVHLEYRGRDSDISQIKNTNHKDLLLCSLVKEMHKRQDHKRLKGAKS